MLVACPLCVSVGGDSELLSVRVFVVVVFFYYASGQSLL